MMLKHLRQKLFDLIMYHILCYDLIIVHNILYIVYLNDYILLGRQYCTTQEMIVLFRYDFRFYQAHGMLYY